MNNQGAYTQESLENHTIADLKDICGEKGLKKAGLKKDLIKRILANQNERWKGFGFFKGTGPSSSKWNLFKSKAITIPLPAFVEEDTNTAIQSSIQDQHQKKISLMKKISQTFNNEVKSLKHKASKRFSANSAAQQGSSITAAGTSKKPSIDVVVLSSELDDLDITEEPEAETMIQQTMPSGGPSTSSTLFPGFTAGQIRKGKFRKGIMDTEAMPDEMMEDIAAGLFAQDVVEEQTHSDNESGIWDSEGEYWPPRMIEKSDMMKRESSDSEIEDIILIGKRAKPGKIESDSSSDDDTDAGDAPPPLPVAVPAPVIPPAQLLTLPCNSVGRNYVAGVPYEMFKTAESSKKACLDPAPVIGLNGKATHLSFQIASWVVMWNGLNKKTKTDHVVAVAAKMKKEKLTRKQIEDSGSPCCGITLQIGDYWYSLACLYGRKTNIATAGTHSARSSGFQAHCRGCNSHRNNLNHRLRMTFDTLTALRYKASMLVHNGEFSQRTTTDVALSIIYKVLRNGGFLFIRTQEDIDWIRSPLTTQEQEEHLDWILANSHYGFRTGSELIILTEAGMEMISFDRTISYVTRAGVKVKVPIDSIGQTIIADSWAFNRLSNELDESATDELIEFLLAGDYALAIAAFQRRNGAGQRTGLLSQEWEQSIVQKWNSMSVESRNLFRKGYRPNASDLPDIRFWGPEGGLQEFQRLMRLNANSDGNLVCEVSGVELVPEAFGIDRVINGVLPGISGEYRNRHTLVIHPRLNDMKESGGRKVFASVETMNLEKQRRNLVEQDHRLATITILRHYLDHIRIFRSSKAYHYNMHRLKMKKFGIFENIRTFHF